MEPEYIFQLMTEKLAGTLSAADEQYLDELIEKDVLVAEKWRELQSIFHPEDIAGKFGRFRKSTPPWQDSAPAETPGKTATPIFSIRRLTAAAIITGICILAGLLYSKMHRPNTPAPALAKQDARSIQLRLSTGQTVNLSQTTGNIALGNARLTNTNSKLSYHIADTLPQRENTLTVPTGLDYRITLSDGSEIWLNAATTLKFPFRFTGPSREITVNGEAYLKIAPDAAHPFIVHLPNSTVQVLGTEFNVNSYDAGAVKVSLVNGAVRMAAGNHAVTLQPGVQAVYRNSLSTRLFDQRELSWRQGFYYFDGNTLGDICKVLPRWYGMEAVMDNPAIARQQFTGRLDKHQPVQAFLESLKATMSVDYYFTKDSVLHFR